MSEVVLKTGAVRRLPEILCRLGAHRCLVVIGSSRRNSELLGDLEESLPSRYDVFSPHGQLPQLNDAIKCHQDFGGRFDCIVAIGGGCIIDTAKAVSLNLDELLRFQDDPSHALKIGPDKIPVVAIPTVAGSGSEVTPFAVVYREGLKFSLSHPLIAPNVALIDPYLMRTVSSRQRAISGIDVIAHGIESMLSKRATEESDASAKEAIAIGWRGLFSAEDDAVYATEQLATAAIAAGNAIAHTRTTIPHAMSYYFTSVHGIPHGLAVSLTMGSYLRLFGLAIKDEHQLERWAASYDYVLDQLGASGAYDVERVWRDNLKKLGLQVELSSFGIKPENMCDLDRHVNIDRFENSPLGLSVEDAKRMLLIR